jgi:multiple sugar transport system ATP-binding protein
VTHDQVEEMKLGTKVVVLNQGVVQQVGTPDEIYERPANTFVADFMGSPPMNLIAGALELGATGGTLTFKGGQRIAVANPPASLKPYNGREVVFGVRPEALRLGSAISGPVHLVENSGSDTFVTAKVGDRNVIARLPGRVAVDHSKQIGFDADLAAACYFDPATGLRIA